MTFDFQALGEQATAVGVDMTKAQAGGGDYTPPAEGFCLLRLVGYFEIGKQLGTFQGKPTVKDKVQLVFELSGPNHKPEERDGVFYPQRITLEENLSLNEKARFFKLFQRLNYAGKATHMVQLVGQAFKGSVIHRKYKGRDQKERVAVDLYNKTTGTYTIEPPRTDEVIDGIPTGKQILINVPPAITPLKAFVWNLAKKEHWDALFIEGEYPERKNDKGEVTHKAKSKNVIQNTIKAATNFKGSPIYTILATAGVPLDLTDAERPDRPEEEGEGAEAEAAAQANAAIAAAAKVETPVGAAADDALNGVL